ncbi:MAG: Asp-tRNA(Asn)/Glu-tRNA(Gln) amidotransferase GatCAB subunit A [Nanoarchaeota archaeon]|nr:Asp-tRNA(Asn)/Glu-tRNA(Gln) amidotransferase GatCAB subunit A [Nanoarchaeota archaeon]
MKTCAQRVEYYLKQIKEKNNELNIFLEVLEEDALKRARELDEKPQEQRGKLFGKCIAIKSNIFKEGVVCSCASKTLENVKAIYNSDVVQYVEKEDAIIIGVVNNDEFAQGSTGEHSYFGKTLNPKNTNIIPGGTSSGSAAAVAASMCDIALGTDTGGSCRNPASHCGVFGLKPSYGRVSRYGVVDSSMSFDQVGVLSNSIEDMDLILEVIGKQSERDATTLQIEDFTSKNTKIEKIGILKGVDELIADEEIKKIYHNSISHLKAKGVEIIEVSIEHMKLGVAAYYPIVYTEVFSGTRKFDGVKYGQNINEVAQSELQLRMKGGELITQSEFEGAYYKKALAVRELLKEEFQEVFTQVQAILLPTTPKLPHSFDETLTPEEEYAYDAFTVLANLAGICSGVVPKAIVETTRGNTPIGMQLMCNIGEENTLFSAMKLLK